MKGIFVERKGGGGWVMGRDRLRGGGRNCWFNSWGDGTLYLWFVARRVVAVFSNCDGGDYCFFFVRYVSR